MCLKPFNDVNRRLNFHYHSRRVIYGVGGIFGPFLLEYMRDFAEMNRRRPKKKILGSRANQGM